MIVLFLFIILMDFRLDMSPGNYSSLDIFLSCYLEDRELQCILSTCVYGRKMCMSSALMTAACPSHFHTYFPSILFSLFLGHIQAVTWQLVQARGMSFDRFFEIRPRSGELFTHSLLCTQITSASMEENDKLVKI